MSTHENRQHHRERPNFKEIPVEKQKEFSEEHIDDSENGPGNEDLAEENARRLDEKRAHPESFEDYGGSA